MSYTDRVFKAMKSDREYDPQTIAAMVHLDVEDVGRCLRLLSKGGGSGANQDLSLHTKAQV